MPHDYRILLYAILAGAAVVYAVFSFPALTSVGTGASTGVSQAEFAVIVGQELAYCQRQPNTIDCQCFAQVSGTILADSEPRVPGVFYANKEDLARGQAAKSC